MFVLSLLLPGMALGVYAVLSFRREHWNSDRPFYGVMAGVVAVPLILAALFFSGLQYS